MEQFGWRHATEKLHALLRLTNPRTNGLPRSTAHRYLAVTFKSGGGELQSGLAGCEPRGFKVSLRWQNNLPGFEIKRSNTNEKFVGLDELL